MVFSLAGARFAMDVVTVREIIWLPELLPIEETPDHIVGIFNLRGLIVPVMDLTIRFGHRGKRYRLQDKVVILEHGNIRVGIITDSVDEVVSIDRAGISRATNNTRYTLGEATVEDAIYMVLDAGAICDFNLADTAPHLLTEAIHEADEAAPIQQEIYFCPEADEKTRSIFHQRALDLIRATGDKAAAEQKLLAVIELDGELYGVDLDLVREFSDIGNITPVPCTPTHIIGNMNLRGEVLTLFDIRETLGISAITRSELKKLIVVQSGGLMLGVPVEAIVALIHLLPEEILPAPSRTDTTQAEHLTGTAQYDDKLLGMLDLEKILQNPELVVDEDI